MSGNQSTTSHEHGGHESGQSEDLDLLEFFFGQIGRSFLSVVSSIGHFFSFFVRSIWIGARFPWYGRQIGDQFLRIGFFSIPIVAFTAIFSGMVLALQSYTGFTRFSAVNAIPTVVALSMVRELGPVLAGLMVCGRVGASIAAEIGTMRVTEQIDAMKALSTEPYRYVIFPRLLSGVLLVPLLVLLADVIGVFGGYVVSVNMLGFNSANYLRQTWAAIHRDDITSGLIKAAAFGLIVCLVGCYSGYYSSKGAQGVGLSTTRAVAGGSIFILFMNYLLTSMLF